MSQETSNYLQGIRLLRDQLIPNLLKEDEADILYWAGKELARSYSFSSLDDVLTEMSHQAFGLIELTDKKRSSYCFHLTGDIVFQRLQANKQASFSLETGFLAEAVQHITGFYTEGTYRLIKKGSIVEIILQSDKKEALD